ncbi:MAG TPA: UbiA prenyltransferase family protein, partial [Acidobacteriota bacterium]|nr:UbiA prenyltransferase family protein [Acidobacteriota bacterium]
MDGLWAALRAGQWVKNVLLAAPLVLSHQIGRWDLWAATAASFALFSLAASSVYLVNDVLDLGSDRHHPVKKKRPLAAGRISVRASLTASALLAAGVLAVSSVYLPAGFLLALASYLVVAHFYSLLLKKLMLIDVFVLAVLYGLRVVAGGQATGIEVSYWLLALTVFLFVSLAFAKRCAEIRLQSGR